MMGRSGCRKLILGCAIAVLAVWYGLSQVITETGPASAQASTEAVPEVGELIGPTISVVSPIPEAVKREQRKLASADWPADPFFTRISTSLPEDPKNTAEVLSDEPRLVLRAIVGGARPLAMIDGLVVAVGDQLADGSTVVAIGTDSVTLDGSHGTWILKLSQ
jgi:hypothetical protein